MSTRYPGGFINRSAPVVVGPVDGEGGSAPGVWTLEQAGYYKKQGTWPLPVLQGGLWSVGAGVYGRLGDGTEIDRSSPVQVGSENNWSKVSCGAANVLAIKADKSLWSWGYNNVGQLGVGDRINRSSPVQVGSLTTWSKINGSQYTFSIAIKTDGTLWSWGQNPYGQLGHNNTIYRSSPVQVGTGTTWLNAAGGYVHGLATKTDGTLWSWGGNFQGQLGQNIIYTSQISSPVQVGSLTTWSIVGCGYLHSVAIKNDGTLWTWGYNNSGELGQNSIIRRSSPVQVGALTTWRNVFCGYDFTTAIKIDGTLWTWGLNSVGQLGDSTIVSRSSPVQVGSGATWLNVAGGRYHSAATKTDGTLWAWGLNNYGQLGQNNVIDRSSPVQVGSGTAWSRVSCGWYSTESIQQ